MCVEVCRRLQSAKLSIGNKCVLKCAGEYKVRHLREQLKCCYNSFLSEWALENKVKFWNWKVEISI